MKNIPAVRFLYDLQRFGIKAGLGNIRALLREMDYPERRFPAIHIAGTNGKGSTSSIIASILTASGFRTGLYTSPHLVSFAERIRIDGREIPMSLIADYTNQLAPRIRHLQATFFEAVTAIAFRYFAAEQVDCAVIETGLGGRLDATNVITPLVSVITNIGYDHTEHLGASIGSILREKAGIIKESIPVVSGLRQEDLIARLRNYAANKGAVCLQARKRVACRINARSIHGSTLDITSDQWNLRNAFFSLPGDHQADNLRVALAALEQLPPTFRKLITNRTVSKGLASIRQFSGLRGRLEALEDNPPTIADVGHNPEGIATAVTSLRSLLPLPWLVIFGVMRDKDYTQMAELLTRVARVVIAVEPEGHRALPSAQLAGCIRHFGGSSIDGKSVKNGLQIAAGERRKGEPLVLIGSHYVIGEALKFIQGKNRT